ncbi:secondary thiamine-phosphate synthase enzyme YjbQ [Methanolobus chelungpuianus]|uniref:Secondary thiamine-phosphate synthase enzyme n=1 Tax=Methanolobus chelungpuianus TaxID=502115 RepID=A0AAE3KX84_9EURY|nr:secondary thiamine-phosphate synthase enzyme YjbQ [Methanolobus chelungpuianus]MCQ6962662.1 secondary thiamine-phosphate synthase enzyme [Methanolobus chelungpuianus]
MVVFTGYLDFDTKGDTDIIDVTSPVTGIVASSGIKDGIVLVFAPGSTAAITTIEYEPGLVFDLREALERLVPGDMYYKHHERWHDGNGHSHIRASLIGQSRSFPVVNGDIMLGTWQQIIFIDLDNRPRSRRVLVQVCGETV